MAIDKSTLPPEQSPKTITSLLGSKLVHTAHTYKHGSITVLELTFTEVGAKDPSCAARSIAGSSVHL